MTKKERYRGVIAWFEEHMPVAETELHYEDPFQLLVAVILSAQCTDKRVNLVTPALFEAYPTAEVMAEATPEAVFEYIRSVSYPNNKAKHLVGAARMLTTDFGGRIPESVEELMKLPGVGRKTANVVTSVVFHQARMAVDTHVFRVANRIGLTTNSRTPLATEKELIRHIPEQLIAKAHHWLILHGRYVCTARKPHCDACGLVPWCKSAFKV
jgi:endonuclease III